MKSISHLNKEDDLIFASNGNYIHPTAEGIHNFKRWFKDSKIKDSQGRPQIMFHGTFNSFDIFDKNKIGSRFSSDTEGFFAISCPKLASEYAEHGEMPGNANVIPLFVSIQNPLIIDSDFLKSEGMQEIGHNDCVITFWDNYQNLIMNLVYEKKCDGVLLIDSSKLKNENIVMMSVALKAKQLKSAIGNSGSFNSKNSSLTDSNSLDLLLNHQKSLREKFNSSIQTKDKLKF